MFIVANEITKTYVKYRRELYNVFAMWSVQAPSSYEANASQARRAETSQRHTMEKHETNLRMVQELEGKLKIHVRWTPDDPNWQAATKLVAEREYRRSLDHLEGLVVACLFEFSKMNRAGTGKSLLFSSISFFLWLSPCPTGYKLRKHIATVLQRQSATIRTALECYNMATANMSLLHRQLRWDEVVKYMC